MSENKTTKKKFTYIAVLNGDRVMLKNSDGQHPIHHSHILYIKAESNQVSFHTNSTYTDQQTIVISNELCETEKILSFYPFARVHKSWMVNVNHIRLLAPNCTHVTIGKITIPVAKQYRQKLSGMVGQQISTVRT